MENIPKEAQTSNLLNKNFQLTILNILKRLKETMKTMSRQTGNISKEIEIRKTEQNRNSEVENTIAEMKILLNVLHSRLSSQKEESVNLKIGQLKLPSLSSKEKKRMKYKWTMPRTPVGHHQSCLDKHYGNP